MLTVVLQGGLGNQMFQYALYRSLQFRGADDVAIDDEYGFRRGRYENRSIARASRLKELFGVEYRSVRSSVLIYGWMGRRLDRLTNAIARRLGKTYYEPGSRFDASVFQKKNTHLIGFWQSEKYFPDAEVQDRLREEFRCPARFFDSQVFRFWADRLRSECSVALHIRRGDYLYYPEVYGDICTELYYERAIDKVLELVPDASFYVFSDDAAYAGEFIQRHSGKAPFMLVNTGAETGERSFSDAEEFFLMSFCRHHIIANSSFSWWASWLADNPVQVIVAPDRWLQTQDSDDIYTERMLRIPGH